MAYGACAIFGQSVAAESHITAQLPKMMSVRELQILGEEREEKDRLRCRESLLAFGLGKNVITVQLHSYISRRLRAEAHRPLAVDAS